MSEIDGGAAAPADGGSVFNLDTPAVQTQNPISTEPRQAPEAKPEPKADPEGKKEPISTRDAIRKAREQVEKNEKEAAEKPADKQKPVSSDASNRGTDGKFAPKDGKPAGEGQPQKQGEPAPAGSARQAQQPAAEGERGKPHSFTEDAPAEAKAPSRFHEGAKAEWNATPQSVRSEVARMEKEFSEGFKKYKESAEAFEPVRKFHEMAKQGGTTLDQALTKYVNLENVLRADVDQGRIPIRGLEEVCRNFGMSLRDVAAAVLGQSPDQVTSQQDATIRDLRAQVQRLESAVGGVTSTFQTQQKTATLSEIEAFAAQNPRFEELSEDIAFFLESKRAKDLSEAYDLAAKLNPAAEPAKSATGSSATRAQEPSSARTAGDVAQTDKGQKSITGAPSSGSDPVTPKRPSSSIREALKRAKMAAG